MIDQQTLKQVENLAAGLADPAREAAVRRHYEALINALHGPDQLDDATDGTQDALAIFEAIAMLIGQLVANMEAAHRGGFATYISIRATAFHADQFREAGKGARHCEEVLPTGTRQ